MASQSAAAATTPSAHVIGNMFVEQYYQVLHHNPEEVHKFYQDSSILSRPDVNGLTTSVTTMQAIDEKVMSSDYKSSTVEIKTVDAQHSYKSGVIVLVTGLLFGNNNVEKKFTQSFFLAPQEHGGYFVLNDVFRYVTDYPQEVTCPFSSTETEEAVPDALPSTPSEPSAVLTVRGVNEPVTTLPGEERIDGNDLLESIENGGPMPEEVVDVPLPTSQSIPIPSEITSNLTQEGMPKKSYASIVKVMKGSTTAPIPPVVKSPVTSGSSEGMPDTAAPTPSPEAPIRATSSSPESCNPPEEAVGFSIYMRNLPLNATASQLEGEFKKYGSITPGGVQVRNHKHHGYCFGFVEFESASAMQSAIEASPVTIAGRQVFVEEKRTTTRGSSSGGVGVHGRSSMTRGGFHSDGFRGWGGYGGRQGYGRSEFQARGEFSGRGGRGYGSRGRENYQRVDRPNTNPAAISTS